MKWYQTSLRILNDADLTRQERIRLDDLNADMAGLCKRAGRATVPLVVVGGDLAGSMTAVTENGNVIVTRDVLHPDAPDDLRLYLLAHELGHLVDWHPLWYTIASILTAVGLVFFGTWPPAYLAACTGIVFAISSRTRAYAIGLVAGVGSFAVLTLLPITVGPLQWPWNILTRSPTHVLPFVLFLCGIGFVVMKRASMVLEWRADKRGAEIIGVEGMLRGMRAAFPYRAAGAKRLYDSKIQKLKGGKAPLFVHD